MTNPRPYHQDDAAVDRFAAALKNKLAASRAKGRSGWNDPLLCPADRLRTMLLEHIKKGDPVDVGNFAMMLFNRQECTAAAPVASKEAVSATESTRQHLSGEQIFEIAASFFVWNAENWRKATQGTIGMPGLLEFTKAAIAAAQPPAVTEQPAAPTIAAEGVQSIGADKEFLKLLLDYRMADHIDVKPEDVISMILAHIDAKMAEQRKAGWSDGYMVAVAHGHQQEAAKPSEGSSDVRARFEAWAELTAAQKAGAQHDLTGWYYFDDITQDRWEAWQAALAQPAEPVGGDAITKIMEAVEGSLYPGCYQGVYESISAIFAQPTEAMGRDVVPYSVALTALKTLRGCSATYIEDHQKDTYPGAIGLRPQDMALNWASEIHGIAVEAFLDEAIADAERSAQ